MRRLFLTIVAIAATVVPAAGQTGTGSLAGAIVRLRLLQYMSSEESQPGDVVLFEVSEDVVINGVVLISRGTPALGSIINARGYRSSPSAYWTLKQLSRGQLAFTISETRSVTGDVVRLSGPLAVFNKPAPRPMMSWHHRGELFDAVVLAEPVAWAPHTDHAQQNIGR
jgi:hypothetical protein